MAMGTKTSRGFASTCAASGTGRACAWCTISWIGATVSPIEFTTALLASQPQFQYGDGDEDITWIRVDVRGKRHGKGVRVVYDLVDRRDLDRKSKRLNSSHHNISY